MPTPLEDFASKVALATQAAAAYYNGEESDMTDAEYDALIESIEAAVDENPGWAEVEGVTALLESVGAGVANGGDVEHQVPMLSLAKKKMLGDVEAFVRSADDKVVLEPKVDGIAAVVRYVDGVRALVATRGNGSQGENITSRIDSLRVNGLPKNLLRPLTFEVRGELFMSPDDMEFSNANRVASGGAPFANPRNATSGTVMRETVRYEAQVSFAAYEVFGDDEREPAFSSDSYTTRMQALSDLSISRASDLLPASVRKAIRNGGVLAGVTSLGEARQNGLIGAATDGCVIKVDSTEARDRLGVSSRHPRWAVAYKYDAVRVETILQDIERAVGRTGNISYTAVLDRVEVDGSMVQFATLHNNDFITSNDLRIGDTVTLWKAGDIIPRIEKPVIAKRPVDSVPYVAPTTCPQCEEELDRNQAIWRCSTPSCSIVGLIDYAVSRDCLDVDGFSVAVAEALVDAGKVSRLSDLFFLTVEDLETLPMGVTKSGSSRVLGNKTAVKIVQGLNAAKSQPLNRVICSLGIRMTGRGMSRRLAEHFRSMDALLAATESDFLNSGIEAVGPTRAAAFVRGFASMREDIERMKTAGVNMVMEEEKSAGSALSGKKICVTGSMKDSRLASLTRTGMTELIEAHGGKASSSVSASTDILVCGQPGSSKYKKAIELGKQILTPDEFADLVGV